jgi:hypothetical protein
MREGIQQNQILLQLKGKGHGFLSWQQKEKEGSESCAVGLHCHEPGLGLSINVGPGHLPVVCKVHLEMVAPIFRVDGLLSSMMRSIVSIQTWQVLQ